jgi:hypothetical protein
MKEEQQKYLGNTQRAFKKLYHDPYMDETDKNAFNNNDDLFNDHIERMNEVNKAKNLQKIRNRKLKLLDHIADTMGREADKEEARYEDFLKEIQKKEIEENQRYRDKLIQLVVDDVDRNLHPEKEHPADKSAEKPFELMKGYPLYERAE